MRGHRSRDLHGLDVLGALMATKAPPRQPPVVPMRASAPAPAVPSMSTPAKRPPPTPPATKTAPAASQKDKAAAQSKMQSDAAAMASKLTSTASKLKSSRPAAKLRAIASVVKSKASRKIAGDQGTDPFRRILGELMGVATMQQIAPMASVTAMLAAWATYMAGVNGPWICGDLMTTMQPLVDRLNSMNQVSLAQAGNAIMNRCADVINAFDPNADPPDMSVGSVVQSIQSDAGAWIAQAQATLGGGAGGVNVQANTTAVQQAQQLLTTIQSLVQQLQGVGDQTLVPTGQNLILQLQAIVANPNDPNLPGNFAQVQSAANTFQQQAQLILSSGGAAAGGGGGGGGGGDTGGGDSGGYGGDDGGFGGGGDAPPDFGPPSDGGGSGGNGGGDGGGGDGEGSQDTAEGFSEAMDAAEGAPSDDAQDVFADVMGELLLGEDVIPKVGQTYTDYDTVLAVQKALKDKGFDPGTTDGSMGPRTAAAIKKMQAALGNPQTGVIDAGVLMALQVRASAPGSGGGGGGGSGGARSTSSASSPAATPSLSTTAPGAAATGKSSISSFFHTPLWTNAPVQVWHVTAGAGVAVVLSTLLLIFTRRKKK